MRDDMSKVIVERPRRGVGYYRTLPNEYRAAKHFKLKSHSNPYLTDDIEFDVDDEFCARKLPMRSRTLGWDCKELNSNLRPLQRFLDKQVGRRWDDVYSEVCDNFGDTTIKRSYYARCRVTDYVKSRVYTKTYYKDDIFWNAGSYGPTRVFDGELYVDGDGILRCFDSRGPNPPKKQTYRERAIAREWEWKRVINGETYEKENGIWFRVVRTETTYMHTYYRGGGLAPIKRLATNVSFRKWTVSHNDMRDLKLN